MILTIHATPPLQIYDAAAERVNLSSDVVYQSLSNTSPVILSDDETPTITVGCDNIIANELIYCTGLVAVLTHFGAAIFTGIVRSVSTAPATISIVLEASAGATPYTAQLSLRETTAWGRFRAREVIPVVYGKTAIRPLEYEPSRKIFVLADHAVQGIDAVYRNNLPEQGYALRVGADSAGATVSFIDLVEALGDGEALRVELRGKMDASGALMDTAEAIARDLGASALPDLPTYPLAGVLDVQRSLRSVLAEVFASVGRAFVPGHYGITAPELWPLNPTAPVTPTPLADTWQVTTQHTEVNVLRLSYARDHEQGGERAAVEIAAFGGLSDVSISAPWLTRARDALDLADSASFFVFRPVAELSLSYDKIIDVLPGEWIDVYSPGCPLDGEPAQVSGVEIDHSLGVTQLKLKKVLEAEPGPLTVTVSDGYYPVAQALALITLTAGRLDVVIRDETGAVLVAADVTLDGITTRRTDNAGSVAFDGVRPGQHSLLIERAGFSAQILTVTV